MFPFTTSVNKSGVIRVAQKAWGTAPSYHSNLGGLSLALIVNFSLIITCILTRWLLSCLSPDHDLSFNLVRNHPHACSAVAHDLLHEQVHDLVL